MPIAPVLFWQHTLLQISAVEFIPALDEVPYLTSTLVCKSRPEKLIIGMPLQAGPVSHMEETNV